jgi:hypothetical protein
MHDVLRRLATVEPGEFPVLSIYLDMRPAATGEAPGHRSGLIVLKDRLREIERTLLPRGADLDSFRADIVRIEAYLESDAVRSAAGVALFACAGCGLFEVVEAGVPFLNQVSAAPLPDLFQLARLLDEQETAVVALVDTNTARLFVTRAGTLEDRGDAEDGSDGPSVGRVGVLRERRGLGDDTVHYRKRSMGGWSQARYQRHIDKHRAGFAAEAVQAIDDLIEDEGAVRLVLAGDEVAITHLRAALSPKAAAILEDVLRLDIRTPRDDVRREVAAVLARAERDDAHRAADLLINAVRGDGLGIAGLDGVRAALDRGQVHILLLAPDAGIDELTRTELVRLAATTGAHVEIVEAHDDLSVLGGIGALLRYRQTERQAVEIA